MLFDTWLNGFATFFVTIDPPGQAAIFLGLTAGLTTAERADIALRGVLIAGATLIAFMLAGSGLLEVLGISMPAFRVAGGLLLFWIAFEMVFERRATRQKETAARVMSRQEMQSIAVFPLAVPLLAGPGAISAIILQAGNARDWLSLWVPVSALVLVLAITYAVLRAAPWLAARMGETGQVVLTRILGILLAALSVQFIADGAKKLFA